MTELIAHIKTLAEANFGLMVDIRRRLHQNPELSFHEFETSRLISLCLSEWGVPHTTGYANTGIIATIEGKKCTDNSLVVAIRADMDALPIEESENHVYRSKNKGVMHACGHDVHTTSLLGAAKILAESVNQFSGKIMLIFQPGEEVLPGGAKLMIDEGIFNQIKPSLIIGQHVMPSFPTGTVGFRSGMYMASADEIYITVSGRGGHAALPHQVTDTVLIASHIVVALQQVVSRFIPANIPSVLSFGKMIADGATNIIPNEVKIAGTFRTMNEDWRHKALAQVRKLARGIAETMGSSCDVEIKLGYPCIVNDSLVTSTAKECAKQFLGNDNVVDMDIRMTSDDFAFYSQLFPACYYRLGVKIPDQSAELSLHSPTFDVDESALLTGAGLLSYLAISFLNKQTLT